MRQRTRETGVQCQVRVQFCDCDYGFRKITGTKLLKTPNCPFMRSGQSFVARTTIRRTHFFVTMPILLPKTFKLCKVMSLIQTACAKGCRTPRMGLSLLLPAGLTLAQRPWTTRFGLIPPVFLLIVVVSAIYNQY
jgi:hypothetical protein